MTQPDRETKCWLLTIGARLALVVFDKDAVPIVARWACVIRARSSHALRTYPTILL
jgi:hypothetical protein